MTEGAGAFAPGISLSSSFGVSHQRHGTLILFVFTQRRRSYRQQDRLVVCPRAWLRLVDIDSLPFTGLTWISAAAS